MSSSSSSEKWRRKAISAAPSSVAQKRAQNVHTLNSASCRSSAGARNERHRAWISAWIVSTVSLLTQKHSASDAAVYEPRPVVVAVVLVGRIVSRKREMDGAVALRIRQWIRYWFCENTACTRRWVCESIAAVEMFGECERIRRRMSSERERNRECAGADGGGGGGGGGQRVGGAGVSSVGTVGKDRVDNTGESGGDKGTDTTGGVTVASVSPGEEGGVSGLSTMCNRSIGSTNGMSSGGSTLMTGTAAVVVIGLY